MMNGHMLITFAVLIVAAVLLVSDRVRADLVALLIIVVLGLSGVLTPQEAFSGFSRSAVITILAIYILVEGLRRSGVTQQVGNLLLRVAGRHQARLVVIVMLAGAFLSLFMNNIAVASILLPAVSAAARKSQVKPSYLMMPLAFATMLGGMATLLTTTNIVASNILRDQGMAGFGLLDFAAVGLPLVVVGVLYMALWGRRRLPETAPGEWFSAIQQAQQNLADVYRLGERLFWARVLPGSTLVDSPLARSHLREDYGLNVVAVERNGQVLLSPPPDLVFQAGDVLLLVGRLAEERRAELETSLEILPVGEGAACDFETGEIVLVEAVLAPRSELIGQTLRDTHFREKYGMAVLAIWRAGRPIRTSLTDLPLSFGDALLLQGPLDRLPPLRSEPDLILLGGERDERAFVPRRGWPALVLMGLTLLLVALFPSLIGEVMLGGALAMVLVGVLTMDQAYQAVEWKSVFLIAGMLPLGIALTKTGAARLLADALVALAGSGGPLVLLTGLILVAVLLSQVMHGAAAVAIVAPMAIQVAQGMGADPRAFTLGVALATSMTFLTPLGHPVNILVMGPGGYRFRDYFRAGLPLTLFLLVAVLLLLPLFWPLR